MAPPGLQSIVAFDRSNVSSYHDGSLGDCGYIVTRRQAGKSLNQKGRRHALGASSNPRSAFGHRLPKLDGDRVCCRMREQPSGKTLVFDYRSWSAGKKKIGIAPTTPVSTAIWKPATRSL